MIESIHKYFKLGIIHWMSYPGPNVVSTLEAIARDEYFDAVEVASFADDQSREKAKRLFEQSHLQVCYGAHPTILGKKLNPNAIDEQERLVAQDALFKAVDEAVEIGATGVTILAGHWEEETKEEAYKQLVKTTTALCDYAAQRGIQITLEVFDYDMEKKALIGPAPLAARFAADLRCRCRNFGLLVDLSHFPTTYEDSKFVVQTLRPYITQFHIGNAVVTPGAAAYGDQHPRFGFPNSANDVAELTDFFRVLRQEGFMDDPENPYVLSIEVKPFGDEDPQIILANTKRVINRAWALA